ncbi:MAG: hypothetical protein WC835_03190 [Candidatus Paceibacterota bacterium]
MEISGLRPLTPAETAQLQEYERHMRQVVIPEIVEQDLKNRERVVESRKWILS